MWLSVGKYCQRVKFLMGIFLTISYPPFNFVAHAKLGQCGCVSMEMPSFTMTSFQSARDKVVACGGGATCVTNC